MRKLFIILLLVAGFVNAQNIIVSSKNSTTTALDSAATYTGTAELNTNYSYLTIVVKSNVSGASNGVIVKMGATATTLYTNQFFTYTTNDSSTNRFTVHLTGKYFKVMYINGTTDQTTFDLRTYLHTEEVLPVDANGNIKVNVAVSALPSGAATAIRQDTLLAVQKNVRSWLAAIMTYTDALEAKTDSSLNVVKDNRSHLAAIKNILDTDSITVVDLVNVKNLLTQISGKDFSTKAAQDSSLAVHKNNRTHLAGVFNILDSDSISVKDIINIKNLITLTNAAIATLQDSLKAKINATNLALVEVNNGIDSVDASSTRNEIKLDSLVAKDFATQTTLALIPPLLDSLEVDIEAIRTTLHADLLALGIKDDTTHAILGRIETDVEEVRTNGVKVKAGTAIIGYTNLSDTPITAAFTAGVAADTLSGTSVTCKGVLITNNSAGKVLYLIHSAAGTTSTGTPIYYLGSIFVTTTNLNKVYLISDTASTDVRILYYQ